MKLKTIADHLGARLCGDGETDIVGLNTIEAAGKDEITFLANPKYHRHLETTNAGAVIVEAESDSSSASLLVHPNPLYAFSQVLTLFFPAPGSNLSPGIAPTAVIDPSARLGADVHIGANVVIGTHTSLGDGSRIMAGAVVGDDCTIGKDCLIYSNVTIYRGAGIGDRVTLHAGTVVGADGFGYAQHEGVHHKIYQVGGVRIEDDVEIGANCTIDRGALGETVIGAGTKIDNLVQIAHNVRIGRGCIIVAQVGISGSTKLGDYVTLAGQVGLVGHIEIGDRAVIAAQAGVPKSIPADEIYCGSPARELMEYKRIEAHIHKLPERVKQLQAMAREIADLKERLQNLEKE
ncbi:MAG: UDP-3-O-(3-hydroxymyristoyl)glucosamine N-acyltransferase [candidate division Zixibacteria bacterium]|nr:UDP-3-O-(3-hydroxymyristoyl)glucosamine N-acyltransferase [candidate division Zixibacteria bacterium]